MTQNRNKFIEIFIGNISNAIVHEILEKSIKQDFLVDKYRKEKFGEIHYQVVGIRCEEKPVCVVVAAVYQSEGWE